MKVYFETDQELIVEAENDEEETRLREWWDQWDHNDYSSHISFVFSTERL